MLAENPIEDHTTELKRQVPRGNQIAIEALAFANSKGGRIIIGYDEGEKQWIGVVPDQKVEEQIVNQLHDCCIPRLDFAISYQGIAEKTALIIEVQEGSSKPYHLKHKDLSGGTYVRVGSTSRLADRETLARLIREGRNVAFDLEVVSRGVELEYSLVDEYMKARRDRFGVKMRGNRTKLLQDLGIHKGKKNTIAGSLLFSSIPQEVPELANAYIKAARFIGTTKGEFFDQAEIDGPITRQIDECTAFVLRNTSRAGRIMGSKRLDKGLYAPEVIRELVVNAVIHRDYSISGACILVAVFDDRIEVTSPGGLPGRVTIADIADRQYNRNPTLAKRMFEMGYFDSWGQGIDLILDWSKRENRAQPRFIDHPEQFTAMVFAENGLHGEAQVRENLVLDLFRTYPHISTKIVQKLGLSKTQAQSTLRGLLEKGRIVPHGMGRAVVYTLK